MSKYVNVPSGNYSLAVQNSGTITLNTGPQVGSVIITGDLTVQGSTTTVTSENLEIKDNILTLNSGETGTGITLDDSGLEMDRGTFVNALFTFNENIQWSDPVTDTTKTALFLKMQIMR
jgi:archaellum component FlaG (FlaF/FlaG flagellin family)